MELTCKQCSSKFRATVQTPLTAAVRVACPSCGYQMLLRPKGSKVEDRRPRVSGPNAGVAQTTGQAGAPVLHAAPKRRVAIVADEPRPFRTFLGQQLELLGFEVHYFDKGDAALEAVRRTSADLIIVNVYLKGKLGVEVSEAIKADPALQHSRVILIGALFRANRFRANPTNLYGADEYIEEQIPEQEFRDIIHKLFPEVGEPTAKSIEPREYDEARRLARLILSDIVIYHPDVVERSIRENNFFEALHAQIEEGRQYYESRVSHRVRQDTEIFTETLQQFVQRKREEIERRATGTDR